MVKIDPTILNQVKAATLEKSADKEATVDFSKVLFEALEKVNTLEQESAALDELLVAGKLDNIHDAVIAAQKAELAVSFATTIQSKVMEAYKEIMRLQI